MQRQRLVIGISGASGAIYGIRLLEELQHHSEIETHLVFTHPAERTIREETDYRPEDLRRMADVFHEVDDIGASIASGSFATMGMIIAPCSIRSASAIAYSLADNLLLRAADVTLKEGRRLILAVRESPLHAGHLKNLYELAQRGVMIIPPMPAFYSRPKNLEEIIRPTVGRLLDPFGISHQLYREWS